MKIVGCDLHARQQTIAMVDTETVEFTTKTLAHEGNAVRAFYVALEGPVVVGIEATGAMQWFLELLEELRIQCRVGHPAKIRAKETRKQKHDRRDAGLIWELLMEDRFPEIWMPSTEQRDLRTLLRDRHQWVKMRARLQHTLQAIALNHALRQGRALWSAAGQSALQALPLPPYADQRRTALLRLYVQLQKRIQELDQAVEAQAGQRPQARRLLTHPGVGPVTALDTEVFLGDPSRFATGNQVASYIGMIPCEHSSGKRQRLGKLTKQGNSLLRYLWTEATLHAVQKDPELKRFYRRKLIQKGMGKARIAAARKLGIRLWIMMRDQIDYEEFCRRGKLRQSGEAQAGMPDFNSGRWSPRRRNIESVFSRSRGSDSEKDQRRRSGTSEREVGARTRAESVGFFFPGSRRRGRMPDGSLLCITAARLPEGLGRRTCRLTPNKVRRFGSRSLAFYREFSFGIDGRVGLESRRAIESQSAHRHHAPRASIGCRVATD